jgi:HSP20 family protein
MVFRKKKEREERRDDNEDSFPKSPFGRDPFGGLFNNDAFFSDFSGINEMMNELMKNAFSGKMKVSGGQPFVYGFSMRTGPDGKPVVEEFGNVKPGVVPGSKGMQPVLSDAREPLVDVLERDNDIIIIAELPGVKKEDIELEATKDSLEIKVDTPEKKYYKVVALPCGVKEDATDASYNNGVLEVRLKKVECKKEKGKKIEIK